ncbi:MAG: hypothetical protein Q8Q08_00960 [Candidatus Omnitrophota bacterium]|nr:hypothetical protein [Candidatus Omnitrophota bacterium]
MKKDEGLYYKIARPDGWDFFTGKTINYREALGGTVAAPLVGEKRPELCAPGVLHASRRAEDCFQGGSIPCSLYRVQGTPVVQDDTKAGFRAMDVIKELDPAAFFKWRYAEAANPVNPFTLSPPEITPDIVATLQQWASVWDGVGASVRDGVGASVGASVRASVWASVWASVGGSVWDSVRAYIGYIFAPVVKGWEHNYPYQPAVDLWKQGLVPSYDGGVWRLHGGPTAEILWEGKP